MSKCVTCNGKGTVNCPQCKGAGRKGDLLQDWKCGHCKGVGQMECPNCHGKGYK